MSRAANGGRGTVTRRRVALELKVEIERLLSLGRSPRRELVERPRIRAATLGELEAQWQDWHRGQFDPSAATVDRYRRAARLLGGLADEPADRVTSVALAARLREVRDVNGPSQARLLGMIARRVLAFARDELDVEIDERALRVKVPPPRVQREYRTLTIAEIERLAAETDPLYRPLIRFLAWTGLRQGEAFGLTVDRVDLAARTVRVDRQLQDGRLAPLKTRTSRRSVPLGDVAAAALREALRLRLPDQLGLVFQSSTGAPLDAGNWRGRYFTPAARRAGLAGVVPHDLRGCFGAHLVRRGIDPKSLQRILGHSTISVTFDTYVEVWPEQIGDVLARLDADVGAILAPSAPHGSESGAQRALRRGGNSLHLPRFARSGPRARTWNLLIQSQTLCQLS